MPTGAPPELSGRVRAPLRLDRRRRRAARPAVRRRGARVQDRHQQAPLPGDKDESFGDRGASWKDAFVGGEFLVHAVTQGPPAEHLFSNFPDYQRYPTV